MNKTSRYVSLLSIGILLLILNSAYLNAYAEASIFYVGNVLLHVFLGCLLLLILLGDLFSKIRRSSTSSLISTFWWPVIFLAGSLGATLLVIGNLTRYRWLLYLHIAFSCLGLLLFLVKLPEWFILKRKHFSLVVSIAFLLSLSATAYQKYTAPPVKITNPTNIATVMEEEGDGEKSPFFPSSATTNTKGIIPSTFFMTSKSCEECHKEIYQQWNSSVHHFSSFNNQWYRKSIEYMQDVNGVQSSKWCAGCHDHAVFFNGRFEKPIKEQIETAEAQAGLACTSCHSITHVKSTMGQGDFVVEYPPLHDLATSENPFIRSLQNLVMKADPEPHKKTFMKPFHRESTAEFCSSCHKVHLDKPVNNYRWFRGFNDYDNWQASGVSGQGGRSFYTPAKSKKCADCHMPLVQANDPAAVEGKVHSHRFPGANTAIPYVNDDKEQLKVVTDFLQDKQISLDIFAMTTGQKAKDQGVTLATSNEPKLSSGFAIGEESMETTAPIVIKETQEVTAPLNKVDSIVRRGDSVLIDVVVRTRNIGHFFPGGTVDGFDVWVEMQAVDEKGQILFWSGMPEDNGRGPVESSAHFYKSLMLDENGNQINKRNAWAARTVAYVRLIPPGAADTIHYRLNIPQNCGDQITLKAKVNHRKFAWWNTQWSYAGVPDPNQPNATFNKNYDDRNWVFTGDTSKVSGKMKSIPNLPIVVMAQDEVKLKVIDEKASLPTPKIFLDKSVRERWNDYGIGLFLQGNIRAAEAAFLKVSQAEPEYADGWINIARTRIQEGRLTEAQEVLTKALSLQPSSGKAHFFMGLTLKSMGKYDEALQHFNDAIKQYPRDRVMLNETGRVLFLKREYKEATALFNRVLQIDPEDLTAHYNLMLCYRGLNDKQKFEYEEKLYRRFKANESSQAITGPFRKLHPEENNERQSIHEHNSIALEKNIAQLKIK